LRRKSGKEITRERHPVTPDDPDDFEHWLFAMDDVLQSFTSNLDESIALKLDYSEESLEMIESLILKQYSSVEQILLPEESYRLDSLVRYVGETFRKAIGGRWEIRLDDPRYAFHGLPQLTGFSPRATPICPHSLVTAAVDRRQGTYLRTILENVKRRLR